MKVNTDEINTLITLIRKTDDISKITVSDGAQSISIERFSPNLPPAISTQPAAETQTPVEKAPQKITPAGHTIKSPMVGVLYLAPAPESPNFVEIGQSVKKGQNLCIIESMKMMNQIEADRAGKIIARLVENNQPVEFDQPLFVIE